MFIYQHRVHFYETDTMGVVHHSNYLRFYEEARVAYAHSLGVLDYQKPETASQFAVIDSRVKYLKPAKFGDVLDIHVQGRCEGNRVIFQYRLYNGATLLSVCETQHVVVGLDLKLKRLSAELIEKLGRDQWKETWL